MFTYTRVLSTKRIFFYILLQSCDFSKISILNNNFNPIQKGLYFIAISKFQLLMPFIYDKTKLKCLPPLQFTT